MDKKALIREYKETKRPAGVYCVRNTVNGKLLVSTSRDLPSILNRQRMQLRATHTNQLLQKELKEFGAEAFEVEVLDTLDVLEEQSDHNSSADLRTLEQMWLDKLSPFGERGYNPEPKRSV